MTIFFTVLICWCIFGVLLIIADTLKLVSFDNATVGLILCGPLVWVCVGIMVGIMAIANGIDLLKKE